MIATEAATADAAARRRLPERSPGRLARVAGWLLRYLRSIPVSLGFAIIVVVGAVATGTSSARVSETVLETWGAGLATTIGDGQWWTVVTALIVPRGPIHLVVLVIAALAGLGWIEKTIGSLRTVVALVVTGVSGILIGLEMQAVGSALGDYWSFNTQFDTTLDPLIPVVGALFTASAFVGPLFRRRIRVVGFAVLLVIALYNGGSPDTYRFIAATVGLFLGAVLHRRASHDSITPRFNLRRSSHAETRNLLALMVAISAIGPVIAALSPSAIGVLSASGWIFGDPFQDLNAAEAECAAEPTLSCAHELAFAHLRGPGSLIMVFVPLILLLLAAYGLRRGRRLALWLALAANAVIVFLALQVSILIAMQFDKIVATVISFDEIILVSVVPAAVPLVLSAILIVNRRHFRIATAPRHLRNLVVTIVGAFVTLWLVAYLVSFATIETFSPHIDAPQLVTDALLRFLPANFLLNYDAVFYSTHPVTSAIQQWVGPVFWLITVVAILRTLTAVGSTETRAGEPQIRRLIHRGAGSLGFMAVWPGNRYWFSADGESAVAYRLIGGVAITLSDPLCRPGTERATVLEFIGYCDANDWTPAFYSVHENYLPIARELGWETLPVAVETSMDLTTLAFTGKSWQNIRTPLNRGTKEGIRAEWSSYADLSRPLQAQIRAISEQWVTEKELPEMGFTLGGFEELNDSEVRVMVAIGPDERVQAVTSWLPSYRDGRPIGWTLDFMRKAPESMPGIMEFLIASAALRMQEDGVEILSLSGAPLATVPAADGSEAPATVMTRFLEYLASKLEPAYGFSSLFKYKAKFRPRYETLSLIYRDPLTLPAIGRAISGAYLPGLSSRETLAVVRTLLAN